MVEATEATRTGLVKMTWLVLGGNGQLGNALCHVLSQNGIEHHSWGFDDLDIRSTLRCNQLISALAPTVIINAAAWTDVDGAETNPTGAYLVNVFGAQNLAVAAKSVGAVFVHISTDYVFPGNKESPYQEDDPVGPVSVYGMSKEAGERAVRTHCTKHVILRTAWVLSATGRNFLTTMLQLAETRDVLNVVADQHGSPTSASDIARVVKVLVEGHFVEKYAPCGTYHCVNSGYTTWADLAEKIFEISKNLGGAFAQVKRITTADYPTAARRPCNSQLLTDKLKRDFGQKLPHWHDAISPIVRDVLKRVS